MKRVALHRGNTFYGVENSLEALRPDLTEVLRFTNETTFDDNDVVMEIDVILKPPFLIRHNTDDKVSDAYIENILPSDNVLSSSRDQNWSFENIRSKKPWELTEYDISRLKHLPKRGTISESKPLILKEVLELAKQKKYRLYLDVKLPNYTLNELSNYVTLYHDTKEMMRIIAEYAKYGVIDCVVSFSFLASVLIKFFNTVASSTDKIRQGVFCWEVFGLHSRMSNVLNTIYMYFVRMIIHPIVVSYSIRLVKRYPHYLNMMGVTDIKNRYVWSIHKTKLGEMTDFLDTNNLTAVVDTFDIK
ncbi:putative phosphodiesterase [Yasminevirus sp. GU-2018]|uniref:Putative phosphodiesterase n=1 Tax=Yasminevirus sp. GU-2018 TaxID=2420051 RepID=A0A5K0UAT5_9VIRU|nr:putative phosphodiesterase [Yasminevirus sp. GU-2018]